MTAIKKKGRKLPAIDHRRDEVMPRAQLGIAKVIMEIRGVRSTSRLVLPDGTITRNLHNTYALEENTPEDDEANLFKAANRLLHEAGEPTYFDIVKDTQARKQSVQKLQQWALELALRHGYLSPLTLAAEYLVAKDVLAQAGGKIGDAWPAIIRFAQAYHWLHIEVSGIHSMAAGFARGSESLATGPFAKAKRAEAAEEIVSQEYQVFRKRETRDSHRRNATHVAAVILKSVNESLIANQLPPFTQGSLRKMLGKLVKRD